MRIVLRHPQVPDMKWKHFNGICEWQQATLGEGHSGYAGWVEKWPLFAEIIFVPPGKIGKGCISIWEMTSENCHQNASCKSIFHGKHSNGSYSWRTLMILALIVFHRIYLHPIFTHNFFSQAFPCMLPATTASETLPDSRCWQQHLWVLGLKQEEQGPALTWTGSCCLFFRGALW